MKISFFSLIFLAFFWAGCAKQNDIPAYLTVQPFQFNAQVGQGSSAQKITDAWVYIDNVLNGVYELPATFPVVDLGSHKITILPGVRNDGVRTEPISFPFFQQYELTKTLVAGVTEVIKPTTAYIPQTIFQLNENFEGNGNNINLNRDNNTSITFQNTPGGFEGRSGKLTFDRTTPIIEKATSNRFSFDYTSSSALVYLEMNYKTEAYLNLGVLAYTQQGSSAELQTAIISLYPNSDWNKIYLDLTNSLRIAKAVEFQLFVQGNFQTDLPGTTASIWLDNVKIIKKN
jgi:hypothetical protein